MKAPYFCVLEFKGSDFAIFKIYPNCRKTTLIFHLCRILAIFTASFSMHDDYWSKALKIDLCTGQGSENWALKPASAKTRNSSAVMQPTFSVNTWILKNQSTQQLWIGQSSLLCLTKTG